MKAAGKATESTEATKAIAFALVALVAFVASSAAGSFSSSGVGTTTAGFLKLGAGARAVAMGEAYSAVADDATALYWNPAALTRIEKRSATFMHAAYLDSSFFDYGAYGQNLGKKGSFGIGVQYFSAGKITETDLTGTETGSFTPSDLAVSLGYAREVGGFSLGLAGKFVRSKILASAQTGAADFGVLSPLYKKRLRLAFAAQNLGGKMKFEQESEDLPLVLRLGSSYKVTDRWLAALDLGFPKDNDPFAALGTEYLLPVKDDWRVALRAGFNSRTLGDVDGFTGTSFGLGLGLGGLGVDYGFLPFGSIGLTHRISLSYKF